DVHPLGVSLRVVGVVVPVGVVPVGPVVRLFVGLVVAGGARGRAGRPCFLLVMYTLPARRLRQDYGEFGGRLFPRPAARSAAPARQPDGASPRRRPSLS